MRLPSREPARMPVRLHSLYEHIQRSRYFNFFDGVQEYVQLAQPVTLSGDFEIECNFYRTSGFGGQFMVANYDTAIGSYGANLYSTGDYGSGAGRVGMFGFANTPEVTGLSVNILYKVRFEYVSATNTANAYLDGNLVSSKVVTPPQGLATSNVAAIGRAAQGGFHFSGVIANVRITDNGTPIHFWPIDDNGTTIRDANGSNNGTLVNPSGGWGLFTRLNSGNWQGSDLPVPPYSSPDQILVTA